MKVYEAEIKDSEYFGHQLFRTLDGAITALEEGLKIEVLDVYEIPIEEFKFTDEEVKEIKSNMQSNMHLGVAEIEGIIFNYSIHARVLQG